MTSNKSSATHIYVSPKHPLWKNSKYKVSDEFNNADVALDFPKWFTEDEKKIFLSKFESVSYKVTEFTEK